MRVDGEIKDITAKMQVDRYKIHDIELVVDRLQVTDDLKVKAEPKCAAGFKAGEGSDFLLLRKIVQSSWLPTAKY